MKIRTKLLGGFLAMVLLLVTSSLIAYVGLTRVAAEVEAVNEEAAEAVKAFELQSAIADTLPLVRDAIEADQTVLLEGQQLNLLLLTEIHI